MDPNLLAFQQAGLADANQRMGRVITFPGNVLVMGVRTEMEIDPGEVQPGGHKYTRVFSLCVPTPSLTLVVTKGMEVTDDLGIKAKVLRFDVDHLGTTIYFASVNS